MSPHRRFSTWAAATLLFASCQETYDQQDASANNDAFLDGSGGIPGAGADEDLAVTTLAIDGGSAFDLGGDVTHNVNLHDGDSTTWQNRRVSVWIGNASGTSTIASFAATLGGGDVVIDNLVAQGESVLTRVFYDADRNGFCNFGDSYWQYVNNVNGDLTITIPGGNAAASACHPFPLRSDVNGDECVDSTDLGIVQANQGLMNATRAQGDTNNDHMVNMIDLDNVANDTHLGCTQ